MQSILAVRSLAPEHLADNLDTERMKEAIDYAHLRGKKLYLTVNT